MSAPRTYIKQGDTRPRLAIRVSSDPTDIFSSVKFNMRTREGVSVIADADGLIELQPSASAQGVISYQWTPSDTANDGVYLAEFEVTFDDGRIETYPNTEPIEVKITEQL